MHEMLTRIREGIVELLPGAIGFEMLPGTRLNRIPDWDSMASVNFQVFLEETFHVKVPDEFLDGESTIGEVIEFIRKPS